MKLTEMQLLQAIGQADEKTVNRTAPRQPEETGRLPIRIRRRALEMIAVCAALCILQKGRSAENAGAFADGDRLRCDL